MQLTRDNGSQWINTVCYCSSVSRVVNYSASELVKRKSDELFAVQTPEDVLAEWRSLSAGDGRLLAVPRNRKSV